MNWSKIASIVLLAFGLVMTTIAVDASWRSGSAILLTASCVLAGAYGGRLFLFVTERIANVNERVSLGGNRPRWWPSPKKVPAPAVHRQRTKPAVAQQEPVSAPGARLRTIKIRSRRRPS